MKKGTWNVIGLLAFVLVVSVAASAVTVWAIGKSNAYTIPNEFSTGTTLSAADMNANFAYVETALNELADTGGNAFVLTSETMLVVDPGECYQVDSPDCPTGYRPVTPMCNATHNDMNLVQFGCDDAKCYCKYKNDQAFAVSTYAKALCANYLVLSR